MQDANHPEDAADRRRAAGNRPLHPEGVEEAADSVGVVGIVSDGLLELELSSEVLDVDQVLEVMLGLRPRRRRMPCGQASPWRWPQLRLLCLEWLP